eukprot:Skav229939  [mRNA]  locus=scaffold4282:46312:47352:+ [translate_table: standard]
MLCAVGLSFLWGAGAERAECLEAAEKMIRAAPSRLEDCITTSQTYKRHLAQFFCGMSSRASEMTALELGVHRGHTTCVLASIFQKVIAVDMMKDSLTAAPKHLGPKLAGKVTFLEMYLLTDAWSLFAHTNRIEVVVIDAAHEYLNVRVDAENALRHLPDLKYLVFHDVAWPPIKQVVGELEAAGMMVCEKIGNGADGKAYDRCHPQDTPGQWDIIRSTDLEGKLCRKTAPSSAIPASFTVKRYLVYSYPLPTDIGCVQGIFRAMANGRLKNQMLVPGTWKWSNQTGAGHRLVLRMPRYSAWPLQLSFNMDSTAFRISDGEAAPFALGVWDQLVHWPFTIAAERFYW